MEPQKTKEDAEKSKEALTTMNPEDKHGQTSHLGAEDIEALVEYLLSL